MPRPRPQVGSRPPVVETERGRDLLTLRRGIVTAVWSRQVTACASVAYSRTKKIKPTTRSATPMTLQYALHDQIDLRVGADTEDVFADHAEVPLAVESLRARVMLPHAEPHR